MAADWTDEYTRRLLALRAEGKTAAQIAEELPFSENAIKGKIWRLRQGQVNHNIRWTQAQKDLAFQLQDVGVLYEEIARRLRSMPGANPTQHSVSEFFRRHRRAYSHGGARDGAGKRHKALIFGPERVALIRSEYPSCDDINALVDQVNAIEGPTVTRRQVMHLASKLHIRRDRAILLRQRQQQCLGMVARRHRPANWGEVTAAVVQAIEQNRPIPPDPPLPRLREPTYPTSDDIAAWIKANGVRKLPTVAAAPTQATIPEADLAALRARPDPDPVYTAARRRMSHTIKRPAA